MNLPIVYLGPSLEINKAKKIINAEFKPPAKKGDFINLNLITERRDIVLIDGVFLQEYPPHPLRFFKLTIIKTLKFMVLLVLEHYAL